MKAYVFSILGLGLTLTLANCAEISKAEADEVQKAFDKWRQIATEVSQNPTTDGVLKLGQGLRKLTLASIYPSEERSEVQADIRAALSTIPNHAGYFSEALDRAIQAEFSEARDAANAVHVKPTRGEIYLTLVQLPSPEVVGLLGKLLYDDRDPWKDEPKSDFSRPYPNSFHSVETLNRIGLEGVQIIELKSDRDYEAALHQWKLWYEQVKAGNRTFRFKGDPQEYNLAGPVSEARVPQGDAAPTKTPVSSGEVPPRAEEKRSVPVLPLVAAGLLLAVALWAATRKQSGRAG